MPHKKVLLIGPLPEPTTGVSLANQVVSSVLKNEGYNVTEVNTSFSYLDEELGVFSFKKLWHNLKYNTQAFKVFSNHIIYFTPGQTFFGVLKYAVFIVFAALSRKRIIIHIHGNHLGTAYHQMTGLKRWVTKKLMSLSSDGIVLSESLKPNLTPFLDEKNVHILPNFAQEYLKTDITKDYASPRFIYLSNLMQEKGIIIFLKALLELQNQNVSYQAQIGGAVTKEMWMQVKPLLLQLKNVDYKGVVMGEEKKALFEWGNVFVLPTYYKMEGQPISILEAMATGSLIITTTQGGIPDIIKNGEQGLFVEKQNVEDLVLKMKSIASNPKIISDIGVKNQAHFSKNFTMKAFTSRLITIFRK